MEIVNKRSIIRYFDGRLEEKEDLLVDEAPLTVYFNGEELVTLLCTPEYQDELAIGFLAAEGLINRREKLEKITVDRDNGIVYVEYKGSARRGELFLKRYITTGCGKGTTFYNALDPVALKPYQGEVKVPAEKLFVLMKEMQRRSELYLTTGGVHSAALCDAEKILLFREDVGRHNAADKIMGHAFLNGISLGDKIFLTSGRISSEIILKVAKMGIGMIVSRSAPTELAIKHAEELNLTVVGFVRAGRLNIYTGRERILL